MRSSVSFMLSHGSGEPAMSHPDYEQHAHHHGALLVLVRGIGPAKPRSLQKIFERLQKVNNVKVTDANGAQRDIWARFVQEHPVENNDWGDFQTHRRLLGLITVGKFDTQTELNELCRIHESLKVKYTNTLYDSRCILFGGNRRPRKAPPPAAATTPDSLHSGASENGIDGRHSANSHSSGVPAPAEAHLSLDDSNDDTGNHADSATAAVVHDNRLCAGLSTPANFKSQAFFYAENDSCADLEAHLVEFLHSLFWILESKRLERSREKVDKVVLLQAPFEKRDFVGLDLDTRNNRRRCMGRITKNLADLTLQAGLVAESLTLFHTASDTLRAISDSLWHGAASEGLCAASTILLYPGCRQPTRLQRNASLPADGSAQSPIRGATNAALQQKSAQQAGAAAVALAAAAATTAPAGGDLAATVAAGDSASTSASSSVSSQLSSTASSSSAAGVGASRSSLSSAATTTTTTGAQTNASSTSSSTATTAVGSPLAAAAAAASTPPMNVLPPDEIAARYRDAIINYSKYRHAGIIETEAALKAARICIEQGRNLDVAMFLQNVLYINLNMNEAERVHRFETLTALYQEIGYHRKAAFCQRLAAWRHVAQSNTTPDWSQSYQLMLRSFAGHRLALDPLEVLAADAGWPCLQIDLLQQLVFAAKRLGQSALATRHQTFLLQTMWRHLSAAEQREMALQLQSLSAQCEGAPVPLVLESGTIIPPANLTDLPICELLHVRELPAHLRPHKRLADKVQSSPFLFTPIHFSSTVDRRRDAARAAADGRVPFDWVQNALCEVQLRLRNPLPIELHIDDMRLLTTGVVFESRPETVILPAGGVPTLVTLHGAPIEAGALEIHGYSTHALGVKSNCRLKSMRNGQSASQSAAGAAALAPCYRLEVLPALPTLRLATSWPQTASFCAASGADAVTVSATHALCNGESAACVITLHNTSAVPITWAEASVQSASLDAGQLERVFRWCADELQRKLPIAAHESIDLQCSLYAEADFLGPIALDGPGMVAQHHQHQHQLEPSSLNTASSAGHASLPSRLSCSPLPMPRRTELSASFRSGSHTPSGGGGPSGHSSLATTISLGATAAGGAAAGSGSGWRQVDVQFRVRYSGGAAEAHCRQCAVAFGLEFLPSAHVTNWDVLPAEIPSQFYLVLDVINLTAQEMTLNYTDAKSIVIEARESCRVPVPVDKCPLERLLANETELAAECNHTSIMTSPTEADLAERACSEHISDQVRLTWHLAGTETHGVCSLRGIGLSTAMMSLITVAPLQWELFADGAPLAPQGELCCAAGQQVVLGVRISNLSPQDLQQLQLTVQFYQDYQNGQQNYKLETRVILSGPDQVTIPQLGRHASVTHECSAIFFTPGRFKANIQCRSRMPQPTSSSGQQRRTSTNQQQQQQHPAAAPQSYLFAGAGGAGGKSAANGGDTAQVWRLIPPLDITVTEQ